MKKILHSFFIFLSVIAIIGLIFITFIAYFYNGYWRDALGILLAGVFFWFIIFGFPYILYFLTQKNIKFAHWILLLCLPLMFFGFLSFDTIIYFVVNRFF